MKILIASLVALFYLSTQAMVLVNCRASQDVSYQVLMLAENELTIQKVSPKKNEVQNEIAEQFDFKFTTENLVIFAKLPDQGFALLDLKQTDSKRGQYSGQVTIETLNKALKTDRESVQCQRYFTTWQ
jgi:hypothetical protein